MELVSIENIKPGMEVGRSILDSYGRTLVSDGVILTTLAVKRLHELGITKVYVKSMETAGIEINTILTNKQKVQTMEAIRKMDIDKVMRASKKIVEKMSKNTNVLMNMDTIRTYDDYTYQHSVGVALLSSMLGIGIGLKGETLERLVSSALLHDIGKTCLNEDVLNAPRQLTEDEYDEVKKHTIYGYNILGKTLGMPSTIRTSVLLHHENEDGTGYPMGYTSAKIYRFAQIIHICDVYDALVTKRPYKEAMTAKAAMQYILDNSGRMFNEQYVKVFKAYVPMYEAGTTVKLEMNGKVLGTALVIKSYANETDRPTVRVRGKDVDLREERYKNVQIID